MGNTVEPREKGKKWVLAALVLILLLSAGLRVLYYREILHNPEFNHPEVDAKYHDLWARAIASGDWESSDLGEVSRIPANPYFRPPGYPYFLSVIYRLAGPGLAGPRIAQMAMGLVSVLVAFFFARKWYGSLTGLIFALLTGTYWTFIYFEGEFLEPALLVLLTLLLLQSLAGLVRKFSFRRALFSGALFGLFALVRPNILLFGPFSALWVIWLGHRRGAVPTTITSLCGLLIGVAVCISPTAIRNYRVSGDPVLVSANAGINLYIGNNEKADGLFVGRIMDVGTFGTSDIYADIVDALEKEQGRKLEYSEVSRYFAGKAGEFIRGNPGSFFRLLGKKALLLIGPLETGHNRSIHYDRQFSTLLRSIPITFPAALSLALLGGILFLHSHRKGGDGRDPGDRPFEVFVLVVLFIVVYGLSFLPFFITGQYRIPIVPGLLLLSSLAIVRLIDFVKEREIGKAFLWFVMASALYFLASRNFASYEPNLGKWYFDRATAFERVKAYPLAIQHYQEAIKVNPQMPSPYASLGALLGKAGRLQEGEALLRHAVGLGPPRPEKVLNNLGNNLARQGRLDESMKMYQEALAVDPGFTEVYNNLGSISLALGRNDDAVGYLSKALIDDPDNALVHANLGQALMRAGQIEEAMDHFRAALKKRPDLDDIRRMLAEHENGG
ncbi:MAG: tetratricopeptide repeat protein [Verrucomicrobia bacterium]|nr:tetratricopeptide repeat protein [Verrucomicrobiota bacterium]